MANGWLMRALPLCALTLALLAGRASGAEPWRQRIQALATATVQIVSVEDEAGHVVIHGTASNNNDVSTFMRKLSDNVGAPSLQILTRGERSEFTMRVKKPAS